MPGRPHGLRSQLLSPRPCRPTPDRSGMRTPEADVGPFRAGRDFLPGIELDSTRSSSCRTACSLDASVSTVLEEYVEVLGACNSSTTRFQPVPTCPDVGGRRMFLDLTDRSVDVSAGASDMTVFPSCSPADDSRRGSSVQGSHTHARHRPRREWMQCASELRPNRAHASVDCLDRCHSSSRGGGGFGVSPADRAVFQSAPRWPAAPPNVQPSDPPHAGGLAILPTLKTTATGSSSYTRE